ncbi:MAG: DNA polymerase III subunit gamma/tau [Muribaculaceae bacterium]|nr:DNA polymerase III subunit gamma/tau [Muribaculaceae bacterium]
MDNNTYIVSARKYRPTTFRSVVGQQTLTHTLKTAISSGRLAHAYLFCGPRGVGKTTCARIFAKTINCLNPTADGEACNECESCRAFNENRSFNITELDAASNNSVDNIRGINEQVRIPPQTGRYRVFIIDEVHMLSTGAFNAFLKTLEEPPEYVIFILATTEKHKIIPTILSRCQIYDFTRITVPDMVQQLEYICQQENVQAEPAALNVIAQKADGAMRDALSIFDQVTAATQGNITYRAAIDNLNVLDYDYYFRLVDAFLAGDVPTALLIYKEVRDAGFDSQLFINGLAQHLRDLMMASNAQTLPLLEMNDDVAQRYHQQSSQLVAGFYYRALDLCNSCDLNYRTASSKLLHVELTLIKLCQIYHPTPLPAQPAATPSGIAKIAPASPQAAPAPAAPAPKAAAPTAAPAATPAPKAAAPAPAPAPAPQVAAPVAAAPAPKPAARPLRTTGTKRILINAAPGASKPAAAEPAATPTPTATVAAAPFTEQQMLDAWDAYIKANPQEQVIINTMLMAKPQKVDDTHYQIFVENQAQVEFIDNNKEKIMTHLRHAVGNDNLMLDVKIAEHTSERRIWTPREVADDMAQRYPKFKEFVKEFNLSLA